MTRAYRDWLPLRAFDDARISAVIQVAVAEWTERWFGSVVPGVTTRVVSSSYEPISRFDDAWMSFGSALMVRRPDDGGVALARAAIDADLSCGETIPGDAQLLGRLAETMIEELVTTLRTAFRIVLSPAVPAPQTGDRSNQGGMLQVECTTKPDVPAIELAIPVAALVPFRKALIGSLKPQQQSPTRLADAFGTETLAFSVPLGCASVTLAEIRTLDLGDILVLDTKVDGLVPVMSSKSGYRLGVARVSQRAGRAQLVLEKASGAST